MILKIAKGCKNWVIFSFTISIFLSIFFFFSILFLSILLQNIIILFTVISLIVFFFLLIFFRDPERKVGKDFTAVADGKIRSIEKIEDDLDLGCCYKISTFMNIYDVHVNRIPWDGIIQDINHIKGSYHPAFSKESDRNERVIFKIKTEFGLIKIILIAGIIARRIIPYVKKNDKLKKGEKISIIRLGSRVDVFIPFNSVKKICVEKNDKTIAGVTKIAEIND